MERVCPGSALPVLWRLLALPRAESGLGAEPGRGPRGVQPPTQEPSSCRPQWPWEDGCSKEQQPQPQPQAQGRSEQDTHCKCLKVMSGKPVALDPEGERHSAST